ncbi:MAG: hypothetical protein IMZ55_12380 [Acidobacteria bacterium]|nr:hypothetical protein [Acidobacteriota bacterium]
MFALALDLNAGPARVAAGLLWHAGFIANRVEVCEELGLPRDTPDANLLWPGYCRWKSDAAGHLDGPVAWAVWDEAEQKLVAASDRNGIHGIFYALRADRFWVAESVEALLAIFPGPIAPNPRAVVGHLAGEPPPPGETFYAGVRAVPPGCRLIVSSQGFDIRPYWSLEPGSLLRLRSDAEYAEALRALLYKVVGQYVPPGRLAITLTSGMDSNSVAAAIRATHPSADLTAITWTAPELPVAHELEYVEQVSRQLNIPLNQRRADLCWPLCRPEGLHTEQAEPFTLYYSEMWDTTYVAARRLGASVLFDGAGGDELFGGNIFAYPDMLMRGRWLEMVSDLRAHVPRSPLHPTWAGAIRMMVIDPIRQTYFPGVRRPRPAPVPWLSSRYRQLFREAYPTPPSSFRLLPGRARRLACLREFRFSRVPSRLQRHACAQGLTVRSPLLDHRLAEFAVRLPVDQTLRAGQRKIILRNAMRGLLPDAVVDMWGKIVPTVIAERGLREREQAKVRGYMRDMRAADLGYVDEPPLRQAYDDYAAGKTDSTMFWFAITLEDWLRRHF